MVLKEFLARMGNNKEKFREAETDSRIHQMIETRQKSANERELDRFNDEEREEKIKQMLAAKRKQKTSELFSAGMLKPETVFNHKSTVTQEDKSVLAGNNMFLKGGNMF